VKICRGAKAGAIVGIAHKYKIPIHFTTMGEQVSDVADFNAPSFAKALCSELNL
jgi:signal recognition particle GTPase